MQGNIRHHLADDAAYILAPLNLAAIDAGGHVSALASCNTAHIVSYMRIAYSPSVGTALDYSGGETDDAACISRYSIFGRILFFQNTVKGVFQTGYISGCQICIADRRIDCRRIFTAQQRTAVLPGNAAGILRSPYYTGNRAAGDCAAVGSGDAAYIAASCHDTGETAIFKRTVVFAHKTAHGILRSRRSDFPLNGQVFHGTAAFDSTEQTVDRITLR